MTVPTLPEIGPLLGRMTDVTRQFSDPSVGLDRIRLDLVSRVFEQVSKARKQIEAGDQDGAAALLAPGVWIGWWRGVAGLATETLLGAHAERLLAAATRRRFPVHRAMALLPDAEASAVVAARIEAAGIPLETLARSGAGTEPADRLRRWAVALDDAWDELEILVGRELAALSSAVRTVDAWRPPLWPWAVTGAVVALTLGWLALAIGGQVARPAWLDPVAVWFWSLPWP